MAKPIFNAGDVLVWRQEFVTFVRMVDPPMLEGLSPAEVEHASKAVWVMRRDGQINVVRLDELTLPPA